MILLKKLQLEERSFSAQRRLRIGGFLLLAAQAISQVAGANPGGTVAGKVISVEGKVLIRNETARHQPLKPLKVGDPLYSGDIINSDSRGSVKLMMTDQTILDLGPSTLFKVNEYRLKEVQNREVSLSMDYGKIRAAVNRKVGVQGKFNIRVKTAVLGVRGTEFVIASEQVSPPNKDGGSKPTTGTNPPPRADSVKTQITVIQGQVNVTDQAQPRKNPIQLTTGKQLTTITSLSQDKRGPASEGSPPAVKSEVVSLSGSEMKAVVQSAKMEDRTFKQAITIDRSNENGSAGQSTLAAVERVVSLPGSTVPTNAKDFGTPGVTFNPVPIPQIQVGVPVNLRVTFKR